MKATKLLEKQHTEVKALFKKIEALAEDADPTDLFEEIAHNLVAHDAIEREIFYPACEEVPGLMDQLGEALVEHGVVEFELYQADVSLGDEPFKYKCKVLKELLLHHIEEEENELFPKVEAALASEQLEALGSELEARFQTVKKQDYRGPLLQNLQKVLSGAIKTDDSEEDEGENGARPRKPQASPRNHGQRAR